MAEPLTDDELPLLTFISLYNIQRAEQNKGELQKLPIGFCKSLNKFLQAQETELSNIELNKDNLKEFNKVKIILNNSKNITNKLLELRIIKINRLAFHKVLFQYEIKNDEDYKNLLHEEIPYFEAVEESIKKLQAKMLKE